GFDAGEDREGWGIGPVRIGRSQSKLKPLWTSPMLASGRLLTASNRGQLVALNPKTGETVGTVNLGSPVIISPIAANGTVYFVTDDAELVAIR
ncbi:MAG TPA: PQQ-binding-like beta-propeller repeat protein, partial [Caulobacteraceae bacterium]